MFFIVSHHISGFVLSSSPSSYHPSISFVGQVFGRFLVMKLEYFLERMLSVLLN